MVSGHITGAYGCLWCVCSDDQVRMTDACGMHGAYIVWNLLEYTGTASTSLAYVKVICVGVESVLQNCVIERCANLHIHVLLQHPFYRHTNRHTDATTGIRVAPDTLYIFFQILILKPYPIKSFAHSQ